MAPGGRTLFKPDIPESGGSVPRDVVFQMIMGSNPNVKKDEWWCDYESGKQDYGREKPSPLPPAPPGGFEGRPRIEV